MKFKYRKVVLDNADESVTGYAISGSTEPLKGAIVFPGTYRNKPVLMVDANVFDNCELITSVTFPNTYAIELFHMKRDEMRKALAGLPSVNEIYGPWFFATIAPKYSRFTPTTTI